MDTAKIVREPAPHSDTYVLKSRGEPGTPNLKVNGPGTLTLRAAITLNLSNLRQNLGQAISRNKSINIFFRK